MTSHIHAKSSSVYKRFNPTLMLAALLALFLMPGLVSAQTASLYVYPAKGQSQAQQNKDQYECHNWAVSQTGFDPSNPPATSSNYSQKEPQGQVVRGAARGAALGSVGGAITGNAGTGAAAGAAMGALAGGMRRRAEQKQYSAQQQQQQADAQAASRNAYSRALAACLQGRGYTVN